VTVDFGLKTLVRLITTIAGNEITEYDDGSVEWITGMQIDSDGAPGTPGKSFPSHDRKPTDHARAIPI
jgi:hypothetical protein